MPELPEVETIRKGLNQTVKGKRIKKVIILLPKMVRKDNLKQKIISRTRGKMILNVNRRGKALLFILDSPDVLIFRLGMTGQMLWSCPPIPLRRDKHTHIIVDFGKGERILFRDMRQFGEICLVKKEDVEETLNMGAEPLKRGFNHEVLTRLTSSSVKIKHLLMDQKRVAGIGNIYSDEILFEAGIHPLKPGRLLKIKELKRLHRAISLILNEAIACKGDTISQYRNILGESGRYQNFHRVYQREGEDCHRCSTPIRRIKIAGRSCHFCPSCQK